jgi:peptidylprolyl isomerase
MTRIGAIWASLALVLGGCSAVIADPNAGSIDDIAVSEDANGIPVLEFQNGLEYTKVQSEVLWQGAGDPLDPGDRILLDMYSVSLDSGVVLVNTFSDLPNMYYLARELVGQELYDVLVDERVGTRILHVTPPVEGYEGHGAVALLVDVLPARAIGETQPRKEGIPEVELDLSGKPSVTVDDATEAPVGLEVATLILGSGAQVKPGSMIVANYHVVHYDTGEVFDSSWDDGEGPLKAQVGVGELPLGLDQGLINRTEGSQILLIVPPELAYGEDTLVFVVDLLAVRDPS